MANQLSLDQYDIFFCCWSYNSFNVCDRNNCCIAICNYTELSVIHIEVISGVLAHEVALLLEDIQCHDEVLIFVIDIVICRLCVVLSSNYIIEYYIYGISCLRNYITEVQIVEDIIYTHYLCFNSRFALYLRNGCANNLIKHNLSRICNAVNRTICYIEILAGEFAHWQTICHIESNGIFVVACLYCAEYHTPELELVNNHVGCYDVDGFGWSRFGVRHGDVIHDSIATQSVSYELVGLVLFGYYSIEVQEINKSSVGTIHEHDVVSISHIHVEFVVFTFYLLRSQEN